LSRNGSMASIASWRMGVEAAWSRYVTIIPRVAPM